MTKGAGAFTENEGGSGLQCFQRIGFPPTDRVAQFEAFRQMRGDCRGECASGAVSVPGCHFPGGKPLSPFFRKQKIIACLSRKVPPRDERRRRAAMQEQLRGPFHLLSR